MINAPVWQLGKIVSICGHIFKVIKKALLLNRAFAET